MDYDQETDFQVTGREPLMWLGTAGRLRQSADAIEPRLWSAIEAYRKRDDMEAIFIVFPYLMLCGMALENIMKGILVARDPSIVQPDRLNTRAWGGGEHAHDLANLADLTGTVLTDVERDFLIRAGEAVLWNGRFPTPTRAHQLEKNALLRSGHRSRTSFTTSDPQLFATLYDRLAAKLQQEAELAEERRRKADFDRISGSFHRPENGVNGG